MNFTAAKNELLSHRATLATCSCEVYGDSAKLTQFNIELHMHALTENTFQHSFNNTW